MKSEFVDDIVQDLNETVLYYENYGPFADFAKNKQMILDVGGLNINNYESYYYGILNLMLDTIETDYTTDHMITLRFDGDKTCQMSIPDVWMNLIMWYIIVKTNRKIIPKYIFFETCVTKGNIKRYIDNYLIEEYITSIDIIDLNNIIDDCLHKLLDINEFSMFLANTINLEDFIILMNENERFNELIHANIPKETPLDRVKEIGMDLTMEMIEIMKKSKHGLAAFFNAQEGINIKQFREFGVNIGTKPDGDGGIFPTIVNTNFLIGGVNDLLSYHIESHSGRLAQIIVEDNVSDSGYFARLLGINNVDSFIHQDPHYDCGTRNFVPVFIKDASTLKRYNFRYYRLTENGMEYLLKESDNHLVNKTILLRSPMTCKSHAEGNGICYKCYGHLAFIVRLINAGKIAAELLSSVLTQKMLSAKHLLEAAVQSLTWSPEFVDYFVLDYNNIKCRPDMDFKGYKIIIAATDIMATSEDDGGDMNEYINSFILETPNGERIKIYTAEINNLYLTVETNNIIREFGMNNGDEDIAFDISLLSGKPIFSVDIVNNDLNDTLNKIRYTINNKKHIEDDVSNLGYWLQELMDRLEEGHMSLASIHAEVILSNQIRSVDSILDKPDWSVPHQGYNMLALKTSLSKHPSISVTLAFEGIKAALYNPLTFKKNKPSFLDLFFVVKPQEYLSDDSKVIKTSIGDKDSTGKTIFMKRE